MITINEYLKELSLSDIEIKFYLTLLESGPLSVRDLALKTNIKRTTAYIYIDQLIEKGLVLKIVKKSRKLIAAAPPKESIEQLLHKNSQKAKNLENEFPKILETLATPSESTNIEDTEIRYYKGKYGVSKIYDEALASPELRLYVNLPVLEKLLFPNNFGMDYDMFERALARNKKLKIYEIIVNKPEEVEQFNLEDTVQKGRYQYKQLSGKIRLASPGILLYDNKVAIINGRGGLSCVVLQNVDYYNNSKDLFDFIWGSLPPKR